MSAELPALLLTGIARGQGSAGMLLELLSVLTEKGILTDADIARIVAALADHMRDFDAQVRGSVAPGEHLIRIPLNSCTVGKAPPVHPYRGIRIFSYSHPLCCAALQVRLNLKRPDSIGIRMRS